MPCPDWHEDGRPELPAMSNVASLAPGPFRTPLNDGIDDDPHVRRFLEAEVPLRRWAAPEELAGAALLLTDPQSAYITGTVLPVDGGRTSH